MQEIRFPLFVRDDAGEIEKFNSVHELQFHVEKIDVENGEFQAWDKDGRPVTLKVQEPVWIKLEPSTEKHDVDGLRSALLHHARSIGLQLPEQLPVSAFETAVDQVRAETEKLLLTRSAVRRFFARFKRPDNH